MFLTMCSFGSPVEPESGTLTLFCKAPALEHFSKCYFTSSEPAGINVKVDYEQWA